MIIKEISTQTLNDDGTRPFLYRDSNDYSPSDWNMILEYLKRNKDAKLLDYEIIE